MPDLSPPAERDQPHGIEQALVNADASAVSILLPRRSGGAEHTDRRAGAAAVLLRRSTGAPAQVCGCAEQLLDAGPTRTATPSSGGQGRRSTLFDAVERGDLELVRLLLERGTTSDEEAAGLRWFLGHGVDISAHRYRHHAISRGCGLPIIPILLDAGAEPNLPWDRWDVGGAPARYWPPTGDDAVDALPARPPRDGGTGHAHTWRRLAG